MSKKSQSAAVEAATLARVSFVYGGQVHTCTHAEADALVAAGMARRMADLVSADAGESAGQTELVLEPVVEPPVELIAEPSSPAAPAE